MPKAKLTELEHFQLIAKYMEIQALEEKLARMQEIRKNAEMTIEVTGREFALAKQEQAAAILLKDSLFEKIAKRVKATGTIDEWNANMDHKNPKKSEFTWPEKTEEESGEDPK